MSIVVNKTRLPVTQWQTESGSVVSISDARKRYAKSLSVALEPIQDLHGYANPWVGGAGKNKYPVSSISNVAWAYSNTNLKNVMNSLPAGTYTISFNLVLTEVSKTGSWQYGVFCGNPNGNVPRWETVSSDPVVGYTANFSYTFTISANQVGAFTSGYFYGCGSNGQGNMGKATLSDIQIESGSKTAYEPYENLCPISGRSSVTANRSGKNLLGTTLYAGVSYNPTVGADWSGRYVSVNQFTPNADSSVFTITLGSWASCAMFAKVKPNTAYKLKASLSGEDCATTYGWLDENNLVLTKFNTTGATVNLNTTITSPNNAGWFYLLIAPRSRQQTLTFTEPQFEYSPQTAYEPYQGISVTLSLGQTVYGCNVDLVSGVMTATKKSVTFIGDNTYYWYTYAPSNYDSFCFAVDLPDKSKKKLTSICDKYKNVDVSWGAGGDGKYCVFSDHATLARLYFRPPYSGFGETVADWKTWLSNNPLQVCYELATPQIIQLSTTQIEMLMRNNAVWSDAGVVTLEYARIRQ